MEMRPLRIGIAAGVIALALMGLSRSTAQQPAATSRIVNAANTFITSLDEKQRKSVRYAFDDAAQRKRWSNLPTAMVPRGG